MGIENLGPRVDIFPQDGEWVGVHYDLEGKGESLPGRFATSAEAANHFLKMYPRVFVKAVPDGN